MPLPTKMWDGCVLGVLLIKCSVGWCLSRNCVKDHPGLNPTHTMCSLIFGHQEERNLKLQTIIDCSAYHQLSDFPQGHTQIRGNSDSIIRIIRKRSFFPIHLMRYCQYQQPIFGRGFTSSGFKNSIRLLVLRHLKSCLCSEWCFAYFFVREAG